MKKLLATTLVLTLALALCATALATNPTQGDGTQDLTGTTKVEHTVGSTYYISIPAAINTTEGAGGTKILSGSGVFSLTAGSVLPANKNLTFTITDATNYATGTAGFKLINAVDANAVLPYEIKDGNNADVALNTAFLTATPADGTAGMDVTLTITTTTAYVAGGTYSDELTITVKLVDP